MFGQLLKLLGLADTTQPEQVLQAVEAAMAIPESYKLEAAAQRFSSYQNDVLEFVNESMENGKIAPYQKEAAITMALKDFDGFKSYISSAPPVIPLGTFSFSKDVSASSLSEAHKRLGLSREDDERYSK